MSESIQKNADGTVTVSLKYPVFSIKKVNGEEQKEEFTKVTFRQFSFGDFKAMADQDLKNESQEAYFIIKQLAVGLKGDAFDQINGEDLQNCIKAVEDFLPKGQQI